MSGIIEKRKQRRRGVNRFVDCIVHITAPVRAEGDLLDVSKGGLKILLSDETASAALSDGVQISGHIQSDDITLTMQFSGRIAWSKNVILYGDARWAFGISFDASVVLPEAIACQ